MSYGTFNCMKKGVLNPLQYCCPLCHCYFHDIRFQEHIFMAIEKRHHVIKREMTKKGLKRVHDVKSWWQWQRHCLWQHAVVLVAVRSRVH